MTQLATPVKRICMTFGIAKEVLVTAYNDKYVEYYTPGHNKTITRITNIKRA